MAQTRNPFLKPRFRGKRFEGRRLPLDVLPELRNYAQMVAELARHLFLQEHGGRQRVPKGFDSSFSLALTGIEDGSAVAVVERIHEPSLIPPGPDYFEQARDLVNETVQAVTEKKEVPPGFPREFLHYFERFGRILREDESIELVAPGATAGPRYNRTVRKHLSLVTSSTYEQEVELVGKVVEADVKKHAFQIETDEGIVQSVLPQKLEDEVLAALKEHHRLDVSIRAVATFDRQDRIQRIGEILELTSFESVRPFTTRLAELTELQVGWLDGDGQPVSPAAQSAADVLRQLLEQYEVPVPFLYPTPEGGLQAEWSTLDARTNAAIEITATLEPDGSVLWVWIGPGVEEEAEMAGGDVTPEGVLKMLQRTGLVEG